MFLWFYNITILSNIAFHFIRKFRVSFENLLLFVTKGAQL